ncbi:RRM 6 family protein [Spraguea lophii 42_110]|uniref:RRM 6 family protein n=1 Tax=Spraguea lophii (strain 42_110) TaxID=1358809 RepID=S7XGI6_SPRLO|nr:RRM 6 family protein [Spraguea lophii 42_110]
MDEHVNYLDFRSIVIYNIKTDISLSQILELFTWVDIESYTYVDNIARINFFSYYFLYKAYENLKQKDLGFLGDICIKFLKTKELEKSVYYSYLCGGTRGIFITQIEEDDEQKLIKYANEYGSVEQIKYFKDRKTIYVIYEEYCTAVQFLNFLLNSPIYFSKKCGFVKQQKDEEHNLNEILHSGQRTVYIGNLQSEIDVKDILDQIKIGMLHNIKIIRDKKIGFITFLDCITAKIFLDHCEEYPLVIKGHKLKIMWGKITTISLSVVLAIFKGSTRGLKIHKALDKEELAAYGEIEHYEVAENTTVFYFSIVDAMQAYSEINKKNVMVDYIEDRCDGDALEKYILGLKVFQEL